MTCRYKQGLTLYYFVENLTPNKNIYNALSDTKVLICSYRPFTNCAAL